MEDDTHHAKRGLRRTLLDARTRVPLDERRRIEALVCQRVLALPALREPRAMMAYAAIGSEIDPCRIVEGALQRGFATYFPRVEASGLVFRRALPRDLVAGRDGIREPRPGAVALDMSCTAVALVPGVGFDLRANRLGRGGGHYDRALPAFTRAISIGIACERQVVERLPCDPWDHPVDVVVTERRVIPAFTKESGSC